MKTNGQIYSNLGSLNSWKFHVKHLKLGSTQQILQQAAGIKPSQRKGRGMDFSEIRPYQAGDEVRHIDWRVTARTQKTHTKIFVEEEERKVLFILEQSAKLFLASISKLKLNLALDILAILAFAAQNQGDKLSYKLLGSSNFKGQQITNLNQFFEIAITQQKTTTPTSAAHSWKNELQTLKQLIQPNTKLVLIGDLFELEEAQEEVQTLKLHNDILAIHLTDYLETNLPNNRLLKVSNGIEEVQINATKQMQLAYKDQYLAKYTQLQKTLTQLGIALVNINTQDDLIPTLLANRVLKR